MGAAEAYVLEEAAAQEAVRQTVRLTLIEGGAAAAETGAAAAEVGTGIAAAEAGAAAGGAGIAGLSVGAATGIGLVIIGIAALGYYLYTRHKKAVAVPRATVPCPGNPVEPAPKPAITPKPVPSNPAIPEPRREEVRRRQQERRERGCNETWERIQRRTNTRRKAPGDDIQGLKYRYWDNICSEFDPSTPEGAAKWDGHQQAFEDDLRGLQNDIDDFEANCQGALPDGAKEYAGKRYPDKSEWNGNSPECIEYRRQRQQRYDDNRP
jgi:hypothetical protein